jgi:hypothetical protein
MMKLKIPSRRIWTSDTAILIYLAAVKFLLHMAVSGQYGIFRDELYYIAASKHLDFGYVDFPPMIAWLTAIVRATLGESLPALRLLPALAGAGIVFLTGRMARELGAGRFGQALAALCVLSAPVFLGMNSLLTMDTFEQLFWALALWILVRLFRSDRPGLWIAFGLVAGISLTDKISFLYLGLALAVGLLVTSQRRQFLRRELWFGGAMALLCFVPYVAWNAIHGFPTVEFWGNYGQKVYHAPPLEFLLQQVQVMNPLSLPVWLTGLVFLFRPAGKKYRALGWMYLVLLILFAVQGAKFYFLAPFYPVLFAAGAQQAERLLRSSRTAWIPPILAACIGIAGLALAPAAMPILPLDWEIRYQTAVAPVIHAQTENAETGTLPQNLADQFGWEAMADSVADAYRRLGPEDRARTCIFAENYGEAGALDFFGPERGLPAVISGHNSYFLWGPGACTGETVLYTGRESLPFLQTLFDSVELAGRTECDHCMPYENHIPIYLCRGLKQPFEEIWPQVKFFL